jgi:hypothetical protein
MISVANTSIQQAVYITTEFGKIMLSGSRKTQGSSIVIREITTVIGLGYSSNLSSTSKYENIM